MKTALLLVFCATFSLAQDMKIAPKAQLSPQSPADAAPPAPQAAPAAQEFKRLATVTWDLDTHKLVWVVQRGVEVDGKFVVKTTDRFEVSPSDASIALKEEKRNIAADEASSLHDLLSVLSLYCVESTVWWEKGGDDAAQPAAVPPAGTPPATAKPGKADPDAKPASTGEPDKKPVQLLPGALIAAAGK